MYLEHFGMNEYPFALGPDPRFYYPSSKHKEALSCLIYAVEQDNGFSLVTGEVGVGKSMVCRTVLQHLESNVHAAVISYTLLDPGQFYEAISQAFDLSPSGGKANLRKQLREFLVQQRTDGYTPVLMIDEAQSLSISVLEEIRQLGNLNVGGDSLLEVIMLGQPELRTKIGRPELAALDQRITLKFHLGALDMEEVERYIDHRLDIVGITEPHLVFDQEAREQVFVGSEGIPRLINTLCDQALLQAYVDEKGIVTAETVQKVIQDREGYYLEDGNKAGDRASRKPREPGQSTLPEDRSVLRQAVTMVAGEAGEESTDLVDVSSRVLAPRDVRLVVRRGERTLGRFTVREDSEVLLGRDPDVCHMAILDSAISRKHIILSNTDSEGLTLEDVGSTNGTLVNGLPVEKSKLQHGDTIAIGYCSLNVQLCHHRAEDQAD